MRFKLSPLKFLKPLAKIPLPKLRMVKLNSFGSLRLNQKKLWHKIAIGYLVVMLIMAVIISLAFKGLNDVQRKSEQMMTVNYRLVELAKEMQEAITEEELNLKTYLLSGDLEYQKALQQAKSDFFINYKEALDLVSTEEEQEDLKKIYNTAMEFNPIIEKVLVTDKFKKDNSSREALQILNTEGVIVIKTTKHAIDSYVKKQNEQMMEMSNQMLKDEQNLKRTLVVNGLIAFLLSIAACFLLTLSITRPVNALITGAGRIAEGDLTQEVQVKSKDEIGQLAFSFNAMARNLKELIEKVGSNVQQVAASAEQLTTSAEQTSRAAEQIAMAVQEVAAGADKQVTSVDAISQDINHMAGKMQEVAAGADHAYQASLGAAKAAEEGNDAVKEAVKQMQVIHQTVNASAAVVRELGTRSQAIQQIVEVITGIAAQTNLLALNAAIEAARAGEHGRGFAVVADEVRKLAEQSAAAAKQISALIQEIRQETIRAVQAMENGTNEVEVGTRVVNRTGEKFRHILQSVDQAAKQVQQISRSTREMVGGSEHIVNAVGEIEEIARNSAGSTQNVAAAAQEQTASMEEISSASTTLTNMAEELQQLISKFKV